MNQREIRRSLTRVKREVAPLCREAQEWRAAALAAVESLQRLQRQVRLIRTRLERRRVHLVMPKGPR